MAGVVLGRARKQSFSPYISAGTIGPGTTGPGMISRGGPGIGMIGPISQYSGTAQPGGAGLLGHGGIRGGRGCGMRSDGSGFTTMGADGSGLASVACAGAALNNSPTAAIADSTRSRDSFMWTP